MQATFACKFRRLNNPQSDESLAADFCFKEGVCSSSNYGSWLVGRTRSNTSLMGYQLNKIRIGTRGSKLALWQAGWVADRLRENGHDIELVVISTQGDVSQQPLNQVGGQGLFTKEIQRELLASNVDLAVHSLKDMPTERIDGLMLAAVPRREATDDVLVSHHRLLFESLPSGATVGTGSQRRAAQLLNWRSDIQIVDIRGNIDSRLRKATDGEYDAIVLAAAGLTRLGLIQYATERLPQHRMLPAIGQGALGLECRANDNATRIAVEKLNDRETLAAVTAERALLAHLLAGCMAPVAALGTVSGNELQLQARVISSNGQKVVEGTLRGSLMDARLIGCDLADQLLANGAGDIIAASRATGSV